MANGPKIIYRNDGSVDSKLWYTDNGNLHRVDGPAKIWYYPDGTVEFETWYQNGVLHRVDGPAFIEYRSEGIVGEIGWWLYGSSYAFDEFLSVDGIDREAVVKWCLLNGMEIL